MTPKLLETAGAKVAVKIGILFVTVLAFLIPLMMIRGIVSERQMRSEGVIEEIVSSNGGRHVISGPVLSVPVTRLVIEDGKSLRVRDTLRMIPDETVTTVVLEPEARQRGIFGAVVYAARITISGTVAARGLEETPEEIDEILWGEARLDVGIASPAGLRGTPDASWNGDPLTVTSGPQGIGWQTATVSADLPGIERDGAPGAFSFDFVLGGGASIQFAPLARTSLVSISSSWQSPSFVGSRLPSGRTLSESGFTGSWQSSSLSLGVPDTWLTSSDTEARFFDVAFGVDLFTPVNHYARVERSVKYGPLFIVLPFVALFLFEMFAAVRIHPIQYLLVGAAKVLFYLLLISLSEHIQFNWAYAVASISTLGVIAVYGSAVLGGRPAGLALGGVIAAEYLFLFAALTSEDYALLIGSAGLFAVLTAIMMVTRRINWYERTNGALRKTAE